MVNVIKSEEVTLTELWRNIRKFLNSLDYIHNTRNNTEINVYKKVSRDIPIIGDKIKKKKCIGTVWFGSHFEKYHPHKLWHLRCYGRNIEDAKTLAEELEKEFKIPIEVEIVTFGVPSVSYGPD